MNILFLANGNTFCTDKGEQEPKFQEPWILLYFRFLEGQGVDPTQVHFELPNDLTATAIKTEDGYNWNIFDAQAGRRLR